MVATVLCKAKAVLKCWLSRESRGVPRAQSTHKPAILRPWCPRRQFPGVTLKLRLRYCRVHLSQCPPNTDHLAAPKSCTSPFMNDQHHLFSQGRPPITPNCCWHVEVAAAGRRCTQVGAYTGWAQATATVHVCGLKGSEAEACWFPYTLSIAHRVCRPGHWLG